MKECRFCDLDRNEVVNTIIEETSNFYITPALGSLVRGYLIIISKKHVNSMLELSESEKKEYFSIIEKYRNKFFEIYGKYPIIFEHGSSARDDLSVSSVTHAHTHIVNHNYKNEEKIIKDLNFEAISKKDNLKSNDRNYIFYLSPKNMYYITYNFKPISQMMRIFISEDLKMEEKYNWRVCPFNENIIKTIEDFKCINIKDTLQ